MEGNSNVTVLAQSILDKVHDIISDGAEHTDEEIFADIMNAALSAIGILAKIGGDEPQSVIQEVVKQTYEWYSKES